MLYYKKIFLVLFGIVVAFFVIEGLLGYQGLYVSMHRYDQNTGLRTLKPSWKGKFSSECFTNMVVTNSVGFHDTEFTEHKPDNVYRIAVLGDSYVEARQVPVASIFHKVLEKKLNNELGGGREFQVYAFGLGGVGTLEHYFRFEKYTKRYKPDMVINMFYDNNDFLDDYSMVADLGFPENGVDEFMSRGYQPSIVDSFANFFAEKFLVVDFMRRQYYVWRGRVATTVNYLETDIKDLETDEESWQMEKRLINLLKQSVEEASAKFVFVSFNYESYSEDKISSFMAAEERFRKILDDDVHYLSLERHMKKRAIDEGKSPFFACDGHWNEIGHTWVAEEIFEFLNRNPSLLGV